MIEGQGNFGCFTKDTKVKLTDGRDLSFEELIEEDKLGKINYTYTVNSLGLISIAKIKKPRLTRKKSVIVEVILDNKEKIRCTPGHLFMLRDATYRKAEDLITNDSLMPLYERLSEKADRINREGYKLIYQLLKNEWLPTHHLADNYNLTHKKYARSAGRVRHHLDFNKLNNNPDNVERIGWGEHWKIHHDHASLLHKNPDYREKIAEGRNKFWMNPVNREKYARFMAKRNIESWKDQNYREKMRRFLSEVNIRYVQKHPERRKELSDRLTRTLKGLWQDSEYRARMHEKIIKGNKNHITNSTGRLKFLNICKETVGEFKTLNEENYSKARKKIYPYGSAPLWETGVGKYFNGDTNLVFKEIYNNHKVVRVRKLSKKEDVYDLTIDETHNFALAAGVFVHNSIDGDSPAAMRYTESRLAKISDEMMQDIEKETVDWQPNYDGTRQEPKVLPARLPNLLLNGSFGIAVGMATSIPPHNIGEVADAVLHMADNPDASDQDLLKFVKGPDFPTGGLIFDSKAIKEAYLTGRGAVTTRAKVDIQEKKNRQYEIIVTEIPYQVNKSELVKRIAELVQEKKIEGIKDLRDESGREGLRIVIELKNDVPPQKILNQLYKHTDLQKNFNFNTVALVDGIQPRLLSLKEVITYYLDYRKLVIKRRTIFDLRKAEERAHILEGLAKALNSIDRIIQTIKKSENKESAKTNLIKTFKFTEIQAVAILEMKLQALAGLEREKIENELKEKLALIKELNLILKSPARILKIIKDDVLDVKEKYGDARRTQVISHATEEFTEEDLVPKEEAVIALSSSGYIKRLSPSVFKSQNRGGKGLIGSEVADEDFIAHFMSANTHDDLLFFTDRGRVFQTKAYEIPVGSRTSKGRAIHNFLELPGEENVSAIIAYANSEGKKNVKEDARYLVMATRNGLIKKTHLSDFSNIRRTGIMAIALKKGDSLNWVKLSQGKDQVMLATKKGRSIRFSESQIRAMGRAAAGVKAINLKKGDEVAGFDIINASQIPNAKSLKFLVVAANGFAKQTALGQYRVQSRGGSGIATAKVTPKTGELVAAKVLVEETEIMALSAKGQIIRTKLSSVRVTGRSAQGVKIMNLKAGDRLAGVVVI